MWRSKVVLYLIVFFSIFKLKIGVYDFTIFSVALAILLFLKCRGNVKIHRKIATLMVSILGVLMYTLLLTMVLNSSNYFYLMKYTRVIISFFSTYIIFSFISKKYYYKHIIKAVGQALMTNIIVMWLQVFSPSFKEIVQTYLFSAGRNNWYRVTGLLNGTSSAGIFLGLSSIVLLYLYLENKEKKYLFGYLVSFPLYPLSAMTGFVISSAGSIVLLYKRRLISLPLLFKITSISIIFSTIFVYTFYADTPLLDQYGITTAQSRVMMLFDENVTVNHGNLIASTETLRNSYNLPEDSLQMIFGNIQPSKSEFATTRSDAGMIVNLHAYGILGLLFLLLSLALHQFVAKHHLITVLTFCYLILFFKNDLLFGRIIYDLYMCVIIIIVLSYKELPVISGDKI